MHAQPRPPGRTPRRARRAIARLILSAALLSAALSGCAPEDAARDVDHRHAASRAPLSEAEAAAPDTRPEVAAPAQARIPRRALEGFDRERGGARATVLALGADAQISDAGLLTIAPTPSIDLEGRRQPTRWRYTLRLRGLGRGASPAAALAPQAATLDEAGFSIQHEGGVTLRYEHLASGLEQLIEVAQRPAGDGPLVVHLDASDDALHRLTATGDVDVVRGDETLFRWRDLVVEDATGRAVPAYMDARGAALAYVIDDREASYPLLIDPLAVAADRRLDGQQAGANFGLSLALVDDLNGDGYDDLAIGQTTYSNPEPDEGRVLIYLGSATGLRSAANLSVEPNITGAQFGFQVAGGDVNGDGLGDLAISTPNTVEGGANAAGRAWLYLGRAGADPSTPALRTPHAWSAAGDQLFGGFGQALVLADVTCDGLDELIVGAHGVNDFTGQVMVYRGQATADPASDPPLAGGPFTLSGGSAFETFGAAIASAGNVNGDVGASGLPCEDLIIGAPGYEGRGKAEVHLGNEAGQPTFAVAFEGSQADARFGGAVAGAGDVNGDGLSDLLIAAPRHTGAQAQEGQVSLYLGASAAALPGATPAWTALGGEPCARFGASLTTLGDMYVDDRADFAVGAPFAPATDACGPDPAAGGFVRAYFSPAGGAPGSWTPRGVWEQRAAQAGARFGFSMSGGADLDRDGIGDLAVGALLFDGVTSNVGSVFVYLGQPACLIGGEVYVQGAPNPAGSCEVCDPARNDWVVLGDGEACEGDNPCFVDGVCQGGACMGVPLDCGDANPCTEDLCVEGVCEHAPAPGASCDDGDFCTIDDRCDAEGACSLSAPNPCDEIIGECASAGVCNPSAQRCVPAIAGWAPNGQACGADNACVNDGACQNGYCVGAPTDCTSLDGPCLVGRCDPGRGCFADPVEDGLACSDGDACTADDVCAAGRCVSGQAQACDDGNPCTADACDPVGGCSHAALADGAACDAGGCVDDSLAARREGRCVEGSCEQGEPEPCGDYLCSVDACLIACASDAHCAPGAICSPDGRCLRDNAPPVADAGPAQTARAGDVVVLDGTASADPDGDPLTFAWSQTGGVAVTLSDPAAAAPRFIVSEEAVEEEEGAALAFELVVSDGVASSAPASAQVTIGDTRNIPPRALIEGPIEAAAGEVIVVAADESSDANGDPLSYRWSVASGAPALLRGDATAAEQEVVIPEDAVDGEAYVLRLIVNDGQANSVPATHAIVVRSAAPGEDISGYARRGGAGGDCGCRVARDAPARPRVGWALLALGAVVLARRRRGARS